MKVLNTFSLETQGDLLTTVEFVCQGCFVVQQAVLLDVVAETMDGDFYCYNCEPKSWRDYAVTLIAEFYPKSKIKKIKLNG